MLYDKKLGDYVDKSKEILSIRVDGDLFHITFFNTSKEYSYAKKDVEWLTSPKILIVKDMICYRKNHPLTDFEKILDFDNYLKFFFKNGDIKTYKKKEVKFINTVQNIQSVRNVLNYFKEVSSFVEGGEDKQFLTEQINSIIVRADSFLSYYLQGKEKMETGKIDTLIYPFGCNSSQREAVKNAFEYNISLIQGPPGTGKTQTILNIVANALVNKKTVAVVSGNNEAIKNVEVKINNFGINFTTAFLGNKENITKFFNEQEGKLASAKEYSFDGQCVSAFEIKSIEEKINVVQKCGIEIAKLYKLLDELIVEKRENDKKNKEEYFYKFEKLSELKLTSQMIMNMAAELELMSDGEISKIKTKLKFLLKYKVFNTNKHIVDVNKSITFLQNRYYEVKIQEIKKEISQKARYIEVNNLTKMVKEHYEKSKDFFKYFIAKELLNNNTKTLFKQNNYRNYFHNFIKQYPIVFSTTHALKKCSGNSFLYDYLIIDEASQVDLVSSNIAFSCAKNVILVGDIMQLQHVVKSNDEKPLMEIFKKYNLHKNFEYSKNSVLQSVYNMYGKKIKTTLLNEHYRCDPHIIGFCNKRFYNDKLIIRTKHRENSGVEIITTESIHARGRTNPRQVEIIEREVIPTIKSRDVGIIAPYRDQVKLLTDRFENKVKTIDTVHKFQGKENEVIILSTVANNVKVYEEEDKFDFLNHPNLLNVAFSRAKKKLIIVTSKELLNQENTILSDFSKYLNYYCDNTVVKSTSVYSVFDLMFEEFNKALLPLKMRMLKFSNFDSENIVATLIKDICASNQFGILGFSHNYPLRYVVNTKEIKDEEYYRFATHRNTHCDFVIFDKLDKSIRLIIEVDGMHHKEKKQMIRDEIKDKLLKNAGHKLLRIPTTAIKCKEKILEALL